MWLWQPVTARRRESEAEGREGRRAEGVKMKKHENGQGEERKNRVRTKKLKTEMRG